MFSPLLPVRLMPLILYPYPYQYPNCRYLDWREKRKLYLSKSKGMECSQESQGFLEILGFKGKAPEIQSNPNQRTDLDLDPNQTELSPKAQKVLHCSVQFMSMSIRDHWWNWSKEGKWQWHRGKPNQTGMAWHPMASNGMPLGLL